MNKSKPSTARTTSLTKKQASAKRKAEATVAKGLDTFLLVGKVKSKTR